MDENNSMNFEFQPVEEPAQESAKPADNYQPFDPERFRQQEQQRTYYYPPSPPPKKQKKDRTVLKIVALVAVVAILGSIGGVLLTKAIDGINKPAEDPAPQLQQ